MPLPPASPPKATVSLHPTAPTAAASLPTLAPDTLTAEQSDPATLGWMTGAPPAASQLIRFDTGDSYRFPQLRWSFSHFRQFGPTANVSRQAAVPRMLPRAERDDIDALPFTPLFAATPMTWAASLQANYTDGIVVLHRGRVVYERYFGALKPHGQHIAMSVTKSFMGTLAATLVTQAALDDQATVAHYVPELAASGFATATVRDLLDMTTAIQYSEDYANPQAEIFDYVRAGNVAPRPADYQGPDNFYAFMQSIRPQGDHGAAFAYKTINTDVLAWVLRRITGQTMAEYLSTQLWAPLGMEQDAYFTIDNQGTEFTGGGLNTGLRDLARFGELMRNHGALGNKQIIPSAVVADIQRGGDREKFKSGGYVLLPGWSYRDMWWITHNAHGAYMARGVHGQAIYIDPLAEMVIARYASHPIAANAGLDPTSLPAYHALAQHLMENPT